MGFFQPAPRGLRRLHVLRLPLQNFESEIVFALASFGQGTSTASKKLGSCARMKSSRALWVDRVRERRGPGLVNYKAGHARARPASIIDLFSPRPNPETVSIPTGSR